MQRVGVLFGLRDAGRDELQPERVLPLLLVELAGEHVGVGEHRSGHHPFGEVVLLGHLRGEVRGKIGSPVNTIVVAPVAFSWVATVRASLASVGEVQEVADVADDVDTPSP